MSLDIFTYVDLALLVAFIVFFSVFLYTRKHNLKRDGLLYLYRTTWGMKLIDKIGTKYKKTLKVLSYVSITSGYLLMGGMIYLTYNLIKIYFFNPNLVQAIKVPPITPLVPYLPQVFKLDFLPPFYFSYWIIIIAIIAITHEMAHGIFMRRYGIKIKSTGFAFFPRFLPVFPAAFVEQDEKSMEKAKNFEQMASLSAGTFANVITAIIALLALMVFSVLAFTPAGVIFDNYAYGIVDANTITSVNGVGVEDLTMQSLSEMIIPGELNEIVVGNQIFLGVAGFTSDPNKIALYVEAPAIRADLSRVITEIDSVPVSNVDELVSVLSSYSPGEKVVVTSIEDDGEVNRDIVLEEHPDKRGNVWLGIGFDSKRRGGFIGSIIDSVSMRDPHVYYKPSFGGASVFIYDMIWWLILISLSVALVNMLPVGIFDGGRFFYLTILSLTKNKKVAEKAFGISTYFFLIILLVLLLFWGASFFR